MSTCQVCGNEFDYNSSPAHCVCASCYEKEIRKAYDEEVFIDPLGIPWTQKEMEKAGGYREIIKMCDEAVIK